MKVYCQSCGSGYSYTLDKPKFCGSCGKLYSKSTASIAVRNEERDQEDGEEDFITDISSLEFELNLRKDNGDKLEDIIGSAAKGEVPFARGRDSSYTKDTIEEDFLKDAGSIKKS